METFSSVGVGTSAEGLLHGEGVCKSDGAGTSDGGEGSGDGAGTVAGLLGEGVCEAAVVMESPGMG